MSTASSVVGAPVVHRVRPLAAWSLSRSRVTAIALACVGLVIGVAALLFKAWDGERTGLDPVLDGANGFLFLAAGVVAHLRRPGNRVGLLMICLAIAWFAEDMQLAPDSLISSLGLLLPAASHGVLLHFVLAFPSGRIGSRSERLVVTGGYLASLLMYPVAGLFSERTPSDLWSRHNLLLIRDDVALADFLRDVADIVYAVGGAAVVVILALRWIRASRPLRRVLGPVLMAGLVMMTASTVVSLAADPSPLRTTAIVVSIVAQCLAPLASLAGVLRMQLGRTAVTTLVERLRGAPSVERLDTLLADALGDPSVRVVHRTSPTSPWVDGGGVPISLTSEHAITEVRRGSDGITAVAHDPALLDNRHVWREVTAVVELALNNHQMEAETTNRLAEARASHLRIVAAADAERRRIERNLHDGAQQHLITVAVQLQRLQRRVPVDPETSALIATSVNGLATAVAELRELSRGLHPAVLTEAGLGPAVEALAQRCPLPIDLKIVTDSRLSDQVEVAAYFVVAEALTNVIKHSNATRIQVAIVRSWCELTIRVADDGVGGARLTPGSGLAGLRDRLGALDGTLLVEGGPSAGTTVTAAIPLP